MGSIAEGFLAGYKVADHAQRQKVLMRQRQEDRDREKYDRELIALQNDWKGAQGDMTKEEFQNSDAFAALIGRHAQSSVFDSFIQNPNSPNKRKVRGIVEGPDGRSAMLVDTYDKDGKVISRDRPITEKGDSREKNPNDNVILASREDLFNGVIAALRQGGGFKDMNLAGDRLESQLAAETDLMLPGQATDPAGVAAQTGGTPPATTVGVAPAAGAAAPSAGLAADPTAGRQLPPDPSGAVRSTVPPEVEPDVTPIESDEEIAAGKEMELEDIDKSIEMLKMQKEELEEVDRRSANQMTRMQFGRHQRDRRNLAAQIDTLQAQSDAISGDSAARRLGNGTRNYVGHVGNEVVDLANAIAQSPPVKGVTKVVGDFFGGLAGSEPEGTPPPPNTSQTERFEHGAGKQADSMVQGKASFDDVLNGADGAAIKPQSGAQKNKIANVNADMAVTVANEDKITRKKLGDYRKALRAQVVYGDITAAQATSSYYAVLGAMKKENKYKMSVDSTNGVVHILNETTGDLSSNQYGSSKTDAKAKEDQTKWNLAQYKMAESITKRLAAGDDFKDKEYMALITQTAAAQQLDLTDMAATSVLTDAVGRWEADVAGDADWDMLVSDQQAKNKRPSLSPYIAARVLSTPHDDTDAINDFGMALAGLNGGNRLTENQWKKITALSQAAAKAGLRGREAMDAIVEHMRTKTGQ